MNESNMTRMCIEASMRAILRNSLPNFGYKPVLWYNSVS